MGRRFRVGTCLNSPFRLFLRFRNADLHAMFYTLLGGGIPRASGDSARYSSSGRVIETQAEENPVIERQPMRK